jgi:hypothetical protein
MKKQEIFNILNIWYKFQHYQRYYYFNLKNIFLKIAPNFQRASELDDYRAPQAYLHAGNTSENGDHTPTDSQSVCDEVYFFKDFLLYEL